ncbi:hypothetical protein KP509_05G055400 [Ceratopteris richardii]|uniref:non-specific serine/threonine protein kinase n=1 Tax=Ceratopteris richardii TaxID=49495 RepID=A0A8T2ULQ7_CERRI|nr:hypothetical protein KP509_05G055400 [Ceratopteris richardii]
MFFTCLLPASMDGKEFHHVLEGLFILLILSLATNTCNGLTDEGEVIALKAIHRGIGDVFNRLRNWAGDDPCGLGWTGVFCTSIDGTDHVTELRMNNNSLNGSIPPELGSLGKVVHILLDNNKLTGELPAELSNISTLLVLQLDNNHFSGSIPSSYSQFTQLRKLSLRNCNLTGAIPDLSAMSVLRYVDLSSNRLSGQLPSDISQNMIAIELSYNQLDGGIPDALYRLRDLQLLSLRNNLLDGSFNASILEHNEFVDSSSVLILDVQENNITAFESGALLSLPNVTLSLFGNPVCNDTSVGQRHCTEYSGSILNISVPSAATSTGARCSSELTCNPTQNSELVYGLYLRNGQCHCAYPLHIGYRLKSPAFAIFPPYRDGFQEYLSGWLNFSGYQVNVSSFYWEPGPRLVMDLKVFPSSNTTQFTDAEVNNLYTTFTTWYVPDNITFGPYDTLFFNRGFPYNGTQSVETSKGLGGGASAGIIIGAVTFTAIVMVLFMILMTKRQRRYGKVRKRRERIKVAGAKSFTYEDMSKATNNFDSSTEVGEGGYGKVFKGTLTDGMIVAIKRAQEGSLQGTIEFYNEIELLSRIHHRNLVSLIGFCDDEDEQMLVYEFMENGSLNDHLMSASSKQALDFMTRIQIALGSSRGILYLHTEANPPIYHRDIKANNILLDSKMRPKVADFGLSKLAPVVELEGDRAVGVSTVVKGTPGYLDPEYFLTSKLTDKSDVYSFGVVLLQFITGKQAITNGKNLVREVNFAYEAGMLLSVIDPRMGPYPVDCIEPFIRLAKSCCDDDSDSRPSMAEVVRELEAIWGLIPGKESMVSGEKSTKDPRMKHSMSDFYNNPVSSDISGIGLMSGTIPTISPR